jgi:hypothetical protein
MANGLICPASSQMAPSTLLAYVVPRPWSPARHGEWAQRPSGGMLVAVVATADAALVRGGSLRSHARRFLGHVTPWAILAFFVGFVVARSFLGPLRWSDLVVAGVFLAFEPVIEWLVHSWVLHARPWRVLGRTVELSATRGHRRHHEEPLNLELVFVPGWVLVWFAPAITAFLFLVLRPAHLAATLLATGAAALLAYEWTHYLIHTSYRPRRRYFRHLWRHHRLHHYRNEGYWFGVTTAMGDVVLGTCPRGGDVPVSPTARTLGPTPMR